MLNRIKKNILALTAKTKSSKGFTLVETLVAISILMLAVTGPLYFASESLKAATYARDQITAFYLAQDAFEQVRKIRDDNLNKNIDWNTGLVGCGDGCVVNTVGGFYDLVAVSSGVDVYLHRNADTGIYSHNVSDVKTAFERVIKIEPTDTVNTTDWTNATEMKVTVTISWKSGTIDREFPAYEFLRKLGS